MILYETYSGKLSNYFVICDISLGHVLLELLLLLALLFNHSPYLIPVLELDSGR